MQKNMRKIFIQLMVLIIPSLLLLTACGDHATTENFATSKEPAKTFQWKMVTSWPKNFPGLGLAPEKFSQYVNEMSGGRLTVKVYGAGELVPGLAVFDTVAAGTVEMGHSGAYYWKGKMPASPIFGAIPFGMTATEFNSWLHFGGGLALWQELYKPFGLIPLAGGNTGAQFGGWFKKEINTVEDLSGLKMRIPGLAGDVLKRAGGVPVTLAGGEIFPALQSGALDASEWVGPYNDLAFGFYQTAPYYYSTVWHEPGASLEFIINEKAFNALPKDLQKIVTIAARAVNDDTLAEYDARNYKALQTLVTEHKVQLRTLPKAVITQLKKYTDEVISEQVAADETFANIWKSYSEYMLAMREYNDLTLKAYFDNRK